MERCCYTTKWKREKKRGGRGEENNNNSICPKEREQAIWVNVLPFRFPRLPEPSRNAGIKYAGSIPPLFKEITTFANGMVLERNCVSTAWIIMNEVPYRQVCLWISNGYSWYCAQSRVKIHKWILSEQTNRNDAKGSWGGFLCHPLVFPVRQSLTSSSGWEAGHWGRESRVNYECKSSI